MRSGRFLLTIALVVIPAEAGFVPQALERWREELARRRTTGLLLVEDGKIVLEWYAPGWSAERPHYTASMAKAVVGGLSLLIAFQDGRLRPEDPAHRFIPGWRDDPRKRAITIRHLATHTSGIEDAEQDHTPHDQLAGWKGDFWKRQPDPFSIALRLAPAMERPGTRYRYSNPGMAALAYCVTASLRDAPQRDIRSLLAERVMKPLGIAEAHWSIGYGRAYSLDGLDLYANWGGGGYTARAVARVVELLLRRGDWNGRRLLDASWVARVTAYAGMPKPDRTRAEYDLASGLAFYTNFDGAWPAVPRDAFAGSGAGNQMFVAIPSLKLIVVRQGEALIQSGREGDHYRGAYQFVIEPLMAALDRPAGYPQSPVIGGVVFDPESSITRHAIDSDNWPTTWGDDDHLYVSYGDGRGFEPFVDRKLSLGYARISGGPERFTAENIRSETGERTGDGRAGAKSSGLVMVDGVLYQWVRNVGNAQLMWSEDRGRTWQWGFKFETSFGSPAFLNFGRNYVGARDEYVYTYSQDGPSAYESYDHLVLARAPKSRLREREVWEFLARRDGRGRPVWTRDLARRGPVFTYKGRCQRVDAVYVPGLRRYLLAVGYNHEGGWGLYDAPEPWGPWTTVFHTNDWGLGPTHGYRLPSKWISADGRRLTLVFSGRRQPGDQHYDAFCTRGVRLQLR